MAEKLMKYYKYISQEKGLQGKFELAKRTKVPSTKAAMEPDSDEIIAKFKKEIEDITGKPAPSF